MSPHSFALDRLAPYADESLLLEERAAVQSHVLDCATCALELKRVMELNAVIAGFPPAPPVNFGAFWMRLRPSLPAPAAAPARFSLGRRAALAFAAASLAVLGVATAAFAADTSLPNSPLYPIKRTEEQIRLTLTITNPARVEVEVQMAGERLREARAMTGMGKPVLAASALREFDALLVKIRPNLSHTTLTSFDLQVGALQQVSTRHEGTDRGVTASMRNSLVRLSTELADSTPSLGVQASAPAASGQSHSTGGTGTGTTGGNTTGTDNGSKGQGGDNNDKSKKAEPTPHPSPKD
jgi:hypothetical protein